MNAGVPTFLEPGLNFFSKDSVYETVVVLSVSEDCASHSSFQMEPKPFDKFHPRCCIIREHSRHSPEFERIEKVPHDLFKQRLTPTQTPIKHHQVKNGIKPRFNGKSGSETQIRSDVDKNILGSKKRLDELVIIPPMEIVERDWKSLKLLP